MERWIDTSHFLNLYPKDHPDHPSNFGDTVYHTCVWLIGLHLDGKLTDDHLETFKKGVNLRVKGKDFIRSPWVTTPMNRDQVMFLVYMLNLIGRNALSRHLIKKYAGFLFPHQTMHFKRSMNICEDDRESADNFEKIDMWMDTLGEISESSVHKNIIRLCIMYHRFPSKKMPDLIRYFNKHFNAWEVMVEYHTRYWPEQPPIHLVWEPTIKRVFDINT